MVAIFCNYGYHICQYYGMKKIKFIQLGFLIFALGFSTISYAQSSKTHSPVTPVRVGTAIVNLGIGVGAEYNGDYYRSAFGTKISAEWGLWHAGPGVITLGPEFGGSFSGGGYYDNYKTSTVIAAMRSAWHYGWRVPGLDTYGGLSAGVGFNHYRYRNADVDYSKTDVFPVVGAYLGASYFVTPQFGFNAEAGYDITNFQVGFVFKLK